MYDVIVIGGGIIGGMILRKLSRYNLSVCLLEKEWDVAMGQSKANSGIVHAGFDAANGSLKAKFNVLGNSMMEKVASDLGVDYINNGSLVVAFNEEELEILNELKIRGENNGVKGLEIIGKERLKSMEKSISDEALGALYAPTGGIVCPYKLTIASIGNAMDNGAELFVDCEVVKAEKINDAFVITCKNGEVFNSKIVINCAGIASEKIANAFGDFSFKIGGRKGEYILLDKECGDFVKSTLFFTPTEKGKGILVSPTVDGNILLGPTATLVNDGNASMTAEGVDEIKSKANKMCKGVPYYNTITSFAGTRAYCDRGDFIIEESRVIKGLINCAGIESPGLTASPAIAEYVVNDLVGSLVSLSKKESFIERRKPDNFFERMSVAEKNRLIKENPLYGKIVCRCEQITEGEITRAIHTNPPARDVDGIKRRTRTGMGRCQGGFCQPRVVEILARELNLSMEEVTKSGKGSNLLKEKAK